MERTLKLFWYLLGGRKKLFKVLEKTAYMMENGIPVSDAVESQIALARRKKDSISLKILRQIKRALSSGQTLSDGVRSFISADEYTLLQNAERTGGLTKAIENLLRLEREKKSARTTLIESISQPLIVLMVAFGLFYYIGASVLPPIISFVGEENLTGGAGLMVAFSRAVRSPLFLVFVIAFFVLLGVVFFTLPVWTGRWRLYAEKLPPWSIYREYVGIMFLTSVSVMVSSGVPVMQALKQMLPSASPYLKERLRKIILLMSEGKSFGEALYESRYNFPSEEIAYDMLIFSRYPSMERKLFEMVEDRLDALKHSLKRNAKAVGTLLEFVVYALVIAVVFSFAQIMLQLQAKIG